MWCNKIKDTATGKFKNIYIFFWNFFFEIFFFFLIGSQTPIGSPLSNVATAQSLATMDRINKIYYFVGYNLTTQQTHLIGLNVSDGSIKYSVLFFYFIFLFFYFFVLYFFIFFIFYFIFYLFYFLIFFLFNFLIIFYFLFFIFLFCFVFCFFVRFLFLLQQKQW